VVSRSKNRRRAVSSAASSKAAKSSRNPDPSAKGRLDHGPPIAVIDIGSNSVRLVAYEGLTRSPTPIFNEKVLAGLGREVQTTGLLAPDAVAKALTSLRRFRALCRVMKVGRVHAIATAACRDATNGPDFIAKAERICRVPIEILSGPREAKLSALGVISGIYKPDGIVGDLGGGSLELIDVRSNRVRQGVTLPLGGLALQDTSHKSLKRAERIVSNDLSNVAQLKAAQGRAFYAVGGTWRALARIHIVQSGYPLRVMHGYSIPAADALDFARRLRRLAAANMLADIEVVADARRPLLTYAALVLEYIIRVGRPKTIVFSTFGVREGLLYEMLPPQERARDGFICAAQTLNGLLSRSARHAEELVAWTDRLVLDWSRWGLGNHLWVSGVTWDPEGILSTIPAICTCMLGNIAGWWIAQRRPLSGSGQRVRSRTAPRPGRCWPSLSASGCGASRRCPPGWPAANPPAAHAPLTLQVRPAAGTRRE